MSHRPSEQEFLDVIAALQEALARCNSWRFSPEYVQGISLTALADSEDVLSGYEFDDDDDDP